MLGLLCELALRVGDDAGGLHLARSALDIALAVGARDQEVDALRYLGQAEFALGHHAAAAQACEQVRAVALEIGSHYQNRAPVGLARVALARGHVATALQDVEPLLAHAAAGSRQPAAGKTSGIARSS